MQEETCHQRLEALFLTGLPTQWVWKKGKKKRKPSRGPGFAHTHIIQKGYISSLFVYFNSWQGRPYLLHASVPSKSHSEITRTTAKHLPGI